MHNSIISLCLGTQQGAREYLFEGKINAGWVESVGTPFYQCCFSYKYPLAWPFDFQSIKLRITKSKFKPEI